MIDRLFTAILVFGLLAFSAAMIGSLMFGAQKPAPREVKLERVIVTAKRAATQTIALTQPESPASRGVQ